MEFLLSHHGKPIVIPLFCSDFLLIKGWEHALSVWLIPEFFQLRLFFSSSGTRYDGISLWWLSQKSILPLHLVLPVWNDVRKEISQKSISIHSAQAPFVNVWRIFDCHNCGWRGLLASRVLISILPCGEVSHNKELSSPNVSSVEAEQSSSSLMPGAWQEISRQCFPAHPG